LRCVICISITNTLFKCQFHLKPQKHKNSSLYLNFAQNIFVHIIVVIIYRVTLLKLIIYILIHRRLSPVTLLRYTVLCTYQGLGAKLFLLLIYRGVDNGAAGAAAAAPIIRLVVVIQKWWTFRRPKLIFLSLYECNLS